MLVLRYILIASLAAICGFGSISVSYAKPLTSAERTACKTLPNCVDIIRRHNALEFDYAVLETDFRRFGSAGRKVLFDVLESKSGNADVARMILALGPLQGSERGRLDRIWTLKTAGKYLPLLMDGHPASRDKLLMTLSHNDPNIRETARRAILMLPEGSDRRPVPSVVAVSLLNGLAHDPMAVAAPYVAKMSVDDQEPAFATLFLSGEPDLVSAAYEALYRESPAKAFNTLLRQMRQVKSPQQSQAIGEMLSRRHAKRVDGFYLKFSTDISNDQKFSIAARAAGMHAIITSRASDFSISTPARKEALMFLLQGRSFVAQDVYLPYFRAKQANDALNLVWDIAQSERWINRDRIAENYIGTPMERRVVNDLIQANDLRSFKAGLRYADSNNQADIKKKINDPINAIAIEARQVIKLPKTNVNKNTSCQIAKFDLTDMSEQMPFFNEPWLLTSSKARVSVDRKALTSAHPTTKGWLAGYDMQKMGPRFPHKGGGLVWFDNKSGNFREIGNFSSPLAVLPDRILGLGMTTDRFWIIDQWGGVSSDVSLYRVELTEQNGSLRHLGALPNNISEFSVTQNGHLLISFDSQRNKPAQAPLRISPNGKISMACVPKDVAMPSKVLN